MFYLEIPRETCKNRPPPEHGVYVKWQESVTTWFSGDVAMFRCSEGFILKGSATSACLPIGKWSSGLPACERKSWKVLLFCNCANIFVL